MVSTFPVTARYLALGVLISTQRLLKLRNLSARITYQAEGNDEAAQDPSSGANEVVPISGEA